MMGQALGSGWKTEPIGVEAAPEVPGERVILAFARQYAGRLLAWPGSNSLAGFHSERA